MSNQEITILGEKVLLSSDYKSIFDLKFLQDNPRVYACTHGEPGFSALTEQEQQDTIYKKLLQEPSVKNLTPEIKRHGGLMEWILVRHDTMEVIEGNSRLAVYRYLHEEDRGGDWELIPCHIVSKLTDKQQAALLNQIHIKGKTKWSAYEKANFSYVHYKKKGLNYEQIGEVFGESQQTIRTRIKVIEMMRENQDSERSHFSYYDVLVRNPAISEAMKNNTEGIKDCLLPIIKNFGISDENNDFEARELRDKLPEILKKPKPKILKKFIGGDLTLAEAYQVAKESKIHKRIKQAHEILDGIEKSELENLDQNAKNAMMPELRKLGRTFKRVMQMVEELKDK